MTVSDHCYLYNHRHRLRSLQPSPITIKVGETYNIGSADHIVVPMVLSESTILGVYGGVSLLVISFVWILAGRFPKISKLDKAIMCWWVFTGLTHLILESYYLSLPSFSNKRQVT